MKTFQNSDSLGKMGTVVLSRNGGNLNILEKYRNFLDYKIEYVEFRYKPLGRKSVFRAFRDWIRGGGELPTTVKMVRGILRGIPSLHHRFIYFRATSPDNAEFVFGTMEFTSDGAVCTLYHTDNLPYHNSQVHGGYKSAETLALTILELFQGAWNGIYSVSDNNCIDYAIRCWNLLEPRDYEHRNRIVISYDNVYLAA